MYRHFENWNDMKHEPRKFWLTATTFFNLCNIIHIHDGESELQTPLLRLWGAGAGGGGGWGGWEALHKLDFQPLPSYGLQLQRFL